jgi:hypothetical protein
MGACVGTAPHHTPMPLMPPPPPSPTIPTATGRWQQRWKRGRSNVAGRTESGLRATLLMSLKSILGGQMPCTGYPKGEDHVAHSVSRSRVAPSVICRPVVASQYLARAERRQARQAARQGRQPGKAGRQAHKR